MNYDDQHRNHDYDWDQNGDTNRSITERVNAHASGQVSKQSPCRGCRRHVDHEQHYPGFVIVYFITHKNKDKKH